MSHSEFANEGSVCVGSDTLFRVLPNDAVQFLRPSYIEVAAIY